jgi:hypothetical protein
MADGEVVPEIKLVWSAPTLFDNFSAEVPPLGGGVYCWIWCNEEGVGEQVIYIGKARDFRNRFTEHLGNMLGGRYTLFRVGQGVTFMDFLKIGAKAKEDPRTDEEWSEPEFKRGYFPKLTKKPDFSWAIFGKYRNQIRELADENLKRYKVSFAPLPDEDQRLDAEAALTYRIQELLSLNLGNLYPKSHIAKGIPTAKVGRVPLRSVTFKMENANFFPPEMREKVEFPVNVKSGAE